LKYEGYFLVNLKIATHFQIKKNRKSSCLFAGVNNLANTTYASMLVVNALGFGNSEPRYYYPGLPGHIYMGIEFRF
jgi:iron complex outermembrane recepter protein